MRNKFILLIGLLVMAFAVNAQKLNKPVKLTGEVLTSTKAAENYQKVKGTEDFEGTFLPFGWSETAIERNWGRSSNETFQINGYSALIGQTVNSPEEMLITPLLTLDGTVTEFSFHAAGVNNEFGLGSSSLHLMYKAVGDVDWTALGDTLDLGLGEADTLLTYDLTSFTDGDYYFAFAASSTFDYSTFTSYVLIDDVTMPEISADIRTITFNATNSVNLDPVEGVDVTFGDQTRTTDETGVALFGLLDDTYDWSTSIYGYVNAAGSEVIAADATVDVAIDPMPVASFVVTDGTDSLEGVSIVMDGQTMTTNTLGAAMFSVATEGGNYEYTASLAGYFDETATITVGNIGDTLDVDVAMSLLPLYTVTFNVTDGTDALEGVSIVVASDTLATDASGVATIDLYDGDWDWAATLEGYYDSLGTVTVAGAPVSVDIALEFAPTYVGIINTDDFESYTVGDLLGEVSAYWGTWSGPAGGGADDAAISSNFAISGNNSLHIVPDKDMVYPLGDQTSGKFMVSYYMLIEAGNEGYYNFQKTSTPGTKWMYDVYFDGDATGRLSIDQTDTATFVYPEGKWFYVNQVIDLDNDRVSLNIDGELVYSWMYSQDGDPANLQLGGINFYGAANVDYYLDDIEFKQLIFSDDFESYAADDLIAASSDYWETWSGPDGGGADDAAASVDYANTPVTSMKIGDSGSDDMVLPLGDMTTGKYHVGFNVLVESGGFEGYYNFQKTSVPGDEYAFDVYFNTDGTGSVEAGSGTMEFSFNLDEFNKIDHYIDLDNDTAYFYVNNMPVYGWKYSLNAAGDAGLTQLGGIDFYAWSDAGTGRSYIDDVTYGEYTWLPVEVVPSVVTFTVTDVDSNPIEGASVEINGATYNTDASGIAAIELFDGSYNYSVVATDFLTVDGAVTVAGEDFGVDIMMEPLYHVTFNLDVSETTEFDPETDLLWLSGATADGTGGIAFFNPWPNAQSNANLKLTDDDGDLVYSVTVIDVYPGDYKYKYFVTAGIPVVTAMWPAEGDTLTFQVIDQNITQDDLWEGVGLTDNTLSGFNIYPNPSKGVVTIGTESQCEVTVTNAIGQVVVNRVVNNNEKLDLSNQTQGLYFITAKTNTEIKTLRLILE